MLTFPKFATLALAAILTGRVAAQVTTDCDPLKQDCPADMALGTSATFNWTKNSADSKIWEQTSTKVDFSPDGALFKIANKNDAPNINSLFHIFWGRVSVVMSAAQGKGIVSSIMMLSADLDEIDWEWVGGNDSYVQSNFFGKGDNSTFDRSKWHKVANVFDIHNYTVIYTQDKIDFIIDDNVVRTVKFDDPLAMSKDKKTAVVGDRYPQTPMRVYMGNWRGGDSPSKGTADWAGGPIDYSQAPFIQKVVSVEVEDFTKGSAYTYGDRSGTWQSIKVASGNSTIADRLSKPQGVDNKFNALPQGARIAIIIAIISVAVISVLVLGFCCIKHRRAGKKERAAADAEWDRNVQELQQYKRMMVAEEELHPRVGRY